MWKERQNLFEWQNREETLQFGRNDKMIEMHIVTEKQMINYLSQARNPVRGSWASRLGEQEAARS